MGFILERIKLCYQVHYYLSSPNGLGLPHREVSLTCHIILLAAQDLGPIADSVPFISAEVECGLRL